VTVVTSRHLFAFLANKKTTAALVSVGCVVRSGTFASVWIPVLSAVVPGKVTYVSSVLYPLD